MGARVLMPCRCPLKTTRICASSVRVRPLLPLEPGWCPLKEATVILGYSQAAILRHIKWWNKTGGFIWWTCRDGQLFVEVDAAPLFDRYAGPPRADAIPRRRSRRR